MKGDYPPLPPILYHDINKDASPVFAVKLEGGGFMKERVLKKLNVDKVVDAFSGKKWKLFEVDDVGELVKVEVPIGRGESYVVELPYKTPEELVSIKSELSNAGFFEQDVRIVSGF